MRSSWRWRTGAISGHVSGLAIYDPSTAPGGRLDAARVRELIAQRIHLLPPFRWRLVDRAVRARPPVLGRRRALRPRLPRARARAAAARRPTRSSPSRSARIFARPLDRARPLWELYVIHGRRGRPRRGADEDPPRGRRRDVRRRDPRRAARHRARGPRRRRREGQPALRAAARRGRDARPRPRRRCRASRCAWLRNLPKTLANLDTLPDAAPHPRRAARRGDHAPRRPRPVAAAHRRRRARGPPAARAAHALPGARLAASPRRLREPVAERRQGGQEHLRLHGQRRRHDDVRGGDALVPARARASCPTSRS